MQLSKRSWEQLVGALRPSPRDVVAFDLAADGIRAVRMRRNRDDWNVVAAECLPVPVPEVREDDEDGADAPAVERVVPITVPARLRASNGILLYNGADINIKLLTLTGAGAITEKRVRDAMGLKSDDEERVGYQVLREGTRRTEALVLATSLPEEVVAGLPQLLPSGRPAPYAIGIAPIGVLNAFMHDLASEDALRGLVFVDSKYCLFAFMRDDEPLLIRFVEQGGEAVTEHVQRRLGVDRETALGIVSGGVVDVSSALDEVLSPLIRQLTLSRDFVERHANRSLQSLHICGEPVLSSAFSASATASMQMPITPWKPFVDMPRDAGHTQELDSQAWMFAASLGGCLGILGGKDATRE